MSGDSPTPHGDPVGDPVLLRRRLAEQTVLLIAGRERLLGRSVDRADLARRINVSKSSLYAYLNGTTLPPTTVFDRLLDVLGADGAQKRRLSTLRDDIEVAQQRRPRGTDPAVPRQLPPVTGRFAGRGAELGRLGAVRDKADAMATPIAVIDGTAGVGKTTLALRWAHQVKGSWPDGQLFADLRGFDPEGPRSPGEVLHGFLQALGAAPESIPAGLEEMSALYRTILAGRRVLIVLDDAGSAEHVRPLLPGTPLCLVLVTSRDRLDGLVVRQGAQRISLSVLPRGETLDLLRHWLGSERLLREPDAADRLIELCAGLPLALSIVAARAAADPDGSLAALAARLRSVPDRLAALGAGGADLDLRKVFRTSYALLPDPAARLFRLLGAHAGPDIDAYACMALLAADAPPLAELDALTRANMLTERAAGRFGAHDLLREFARDLVRRSDEGERRAAIERVLDHYLYQAVLAARAIEPCRVADLPPAGRPARSRSRAGPPIDGRAQGMAWFATELPALRAAMEQAAAEGFDRHAWRLAWAAAVFLRRTGRRAERVALHRIGLAAARRSGDRAVRATSMRLLGDGLARLGRHEEALSLLRTSLAECAEIGDARGVFQAHLSLTRLHDSAGDRAVALEHAEDALRSPATADDPLARADALTHVTVQLERLGRNAEALPLGRRALGLYRRIGYAEGEAAALRSLGRIERRLGRPERAIARYDRSLEIDRLLGDRFWTAHVLEELADAHQEAGDLARARTHRAEALAAFESMRHPSADRIRARLAVDPP